MTQTVNLVCGFGRCGTSMVMQMLQAGGALTTGEWPAYEDERSFDGAWIARQQGKVVKVLDPHLVNLPAADYRILWLDRNPKQQAKSQVKLLREMGGLSVRPGAAKVMSASMRKDRPKAVAKLRRLGLLKVMRFESILATPTSAAAEIDAWFDMTGDIVAMADVVQPRRPECMKGLLEADQIQNEAG